MATLYELADNYKKLMDYANDTLENDNVDEDTLTMLIDSLDAIQDSMESKVENIGKFIKNLEGDIAAFKAEEKRLSNRRKAMENKVERLKTYTKEMLELAGKEKIQAGIFNVRLQKNNPSVVILDESKIPEQYRIKQPDKIANAEILKALKEGQTVAGATLAPESKHIRFS